MSEYSPDAWVILKLTNKGKVHYRVFAGWYGGYTGSDSWKMNSGIVKTIVGCNHYTFVGESGSTYRCHKEAERMSGYMSQVFASFVEQQNEDFQIEVIDIEDLPK